MQCKYCNTENPDSAEYCFKCGKYLGEFKPSNVMTTISCITAIVLSIAVTVFTFFIGIPKTFMFYNGISLLSFFRDLGYFFSGFEDTSYVYIITYLLSLLLSVGTICSIVALSVITIVKCVKGLINKSKGNGNYAVIAFFIYIGAAIMLLLMWGFIFYSDGERPLNGATIAGIVVCGVLTILYCITTALSNAKEQSEKPDKINMLFDWGAIIIPTITIFLFIFAPVIVVNSHTQIEVGVSQLMLCMEYGLGYGVKNEALIAILMFTAFLLYAFTLIGTIILLIDRIKDMISGVYDKKRSLGMSIAISVAALLSPVLTMIGLKIFGLLDAKAFVSFGIMIAVVILSAISLALNIAQDILRKKRQLFSEKAEENA